MNKIMNVVISGLNNYTGLRSISLMGDEKWQMYAITRSRTLLENRMFEPLHAALLEMDLVQYDGSLPVKWPRMQAAYYFTQVPTLSDAFGMRLELLCLRNFIRFIHDLGCNRLVYIARLMDKVFVEPIMHLLKEFGVDYTIVLKHSVLGCESLVDRVVRKACKHSFFPYAKVQIGRFLQPLGAKDFIRWLKRVLEMDCFRGKVLEIGGTESFSFQELLMLYKKLGLIAAVPRFLRMPQKIVRFFYTQTLGMDNSDLEELNNTVSLDNITANVWTADMSFALSSVEDILRSDYKL